MDAPEGVLKHVYTIMEIFTKINRILGNKALIATAFGVPLVESTPVLIRASTIYLVAIKELEVLIP